MEDKPNYYAIIPANVRYDNQLSAFEKLLYGEITALASKEGECWAGNSYFADLYNTTKETISRRISNLKDRGYILVSMEYEQESKEIKKRIITPIDKNINTYYQKHQEGIDENIKRGIDENVKDNNTRNNNTRNNNNISSFDNEELHNHFEKIWEIYPVKKGKQKAETYFFAWIKGRKINGKTLKLTDREMWHAVYTYSKEIEETERELKYIPHGDTFFNSKIYDYYEVWRDENGI